MKNQLQHEFPGGAPRCIYCNTLATQHERTACPGPQGQSAEKLRPEPARREYAVDDAAAISARIAELSAERTAAMNQPEDDAALFYGLEAGPVDEGGAQY